MARLGDHKGAPLGARSGPLPRPGPAPRQRLQADRAGAIRRGPPRPSV